MGTLHTNPRVTLGALRTLRTDAGIPLRTLRTRIALRTLHTRATLRTLRTDARIALSTLRALRALRADTRSALSTLRTLHTRVALRTLRTDADIPLRTLRALRTLHTRVALRTVRTDADIPLRTLSTLRALRTDARLPLSTLRTRATLRTLRTDADIPLSTLRTRIPLRTLRTDTDIPLSTLRTRIPLRTLRTDTDIPLRTLRALRTLRTSLSSVSLRPAVLVMVPVTVSGNGPVGALQSDAARGASLVDRVGEGRSARNNVEHYGKCARRNQRGGCQPRIADSFATHQGTFLIELEVNKPQLHASRGCTHLVCTSHNPLARVKLFFSAAELIAATRPFRNRRSPERQWNRYISVVIHPVRSDSCTTVIGKTAPDRTLVGQATSSPSSSKRPELIRHDDEG
ncbi:hypothetical protein ADL25_10165 [Streptomyces sp. NRRL F-5122]|uniref:hypothetical protein n=1 Tax=Streptomyces sp. NRRL F-5122 TaxID=1609098 RepID=UPI00074133EB|nr:hypothetical protein [Streptomyces sp. NRRL F-5122]KUJ49823.1 hypothetical protein ADL25_10165 [Streptomyces sp. NRRL F-5122]